MITDINTSKEQKSDDKRIIVYPSRYEIKAGKRESVESVINGIRTKISRDFIAKDNLPVAYFSVLDFNGRKTRNNVTCHSGMIVIDIDVKDNPNTDFETLYSNLQWNVYTYACFRSPSNGIKLVVNTDIQDINHHDAYYQAITEYLLDYYKSLDKIDTTGSNVNRACYLPFDTTAFYYPDATTFRVTKEYIEEYQRKNPVKSTSSSSPKVLLQVKYLSYDDHYENIKSVINNWTSMGVKQNNSETSQGTESNQELFPNSELIGTSLGIGQSGYGTSVGLYDCIFNEIRYYGIRYIVMSSEVPYFEILFLKHCTPSKVERNTRIDEKYFNDYPEKRISLDEFEGIDGLEVCEAKTTGVIREGKRGKTLASLCMKLIYNNPFCHPALIARELQTINYHYCEDLNPDNPAPDELEINDIVSTCYQKFIFGELDFTEVMRKKKNFKDISKRKVFCSRFHDEMKPDEKQKLCHKTYTDGNRKKKIRNYEKAVESLQDGKKITVTRIAEYMGMSRKQVSRYRTDEKYKGVMDAIQMKIDTYNKSLTEKQMQEKN